MDGTLASCYLGTYHPCRAVVMPNTLSACAASMIQLAET